MLNLASDSYLFGGRSLIELFCVHPTSAVVVHWLTILAFESQKSRQLFCVDDRQPLTDCHSLAFLPLLFNQFPSRFYVVITDVR